MAIKKIKAYDPYRDSDKIHIDVHLKAAYPIKHIRVNTVVTKTGILFEK